MALFLALFCCCNSGIEPNPQADYQQARLVMLKGELREAQRLANAGCERYSTQSVEWSWKFRILEGEVLAYRGLYQESLSTLSPALPLGLATGDEAIRKHMVEALALARSGREGEANEHLQKADRLTRLTQSNLDGELAQIQGVIALGRNDLEQAEVFFRQGLQAASSHKDTLLESTILLNLGLTALKQEHFDNSVLWSTKAYQLLEAQGMQFAKQKALGNLGWAYYWMGDSDKSLFYFQQAADEARKLEARNDLAKWLKALGTVAETVNQFDIAEGYYQQSLVLAQHSQNLQDLVDSITALAVVSVHEKQWDKGDRLAKQAIELCHPRNYRTGELDAMLVLAKIARHNGDYSMAKDLFHKVIADHESALAVQWEARENLAGLYEDQHHPLDAAREYALALASFEKARGTLKEEEHRLPFYANAAHLQDNYIHFLVTQGEIAKALRVADYSRAQTLAEAFGNLSNGPAADPLHEAHSPQQVAATLNVTILFYWLGQKYCYLWIVTPTELRVVPLSALSVIDTLVGTYRRELQGPRDVLATASQAGIDLYNILVLPASHEIARGARTIVISDGVLHRLNFESLLVSKPTLHYLIEDTTIINSSSIRLLKASAPGILRAPKLLLIGDPISAGHDYSDLPSAIVEVNRIKDHFTPSDRTLFTASSATSRAYLESNLEEFSHIHFAAHGTASELSPLDSAIILSRAAAEDDSFKLYARDIIRRPINAELVTISSCYGAGTRAYTGEGLVGLSWAFLHAGAHNVIATLWEASDAVSPRLMDALYAELARGSTPDAALRSAKLSLLHSDSIFRKPLYWTPFQLYSHQVTPTAIEIVRATSIHREPVVVIHAD